MSIYDKQQQRADIYDVSLLQINVLGRMIFRIQSEHRVANEFLNTFEPQGAHFKHFGMCSGIAGLANISFSPKKPLQGVVETMLV